MIKLLFFGGLLDAIDTMSSPELPVPDNENAPPVAGDTASFAGKVSVLTSYEFWLTIAVLLFGVFVIVIGCRHLASRKNHTPDQIIKLVSVALTVIGTLVIITGGFSGEQIAPAFGLFGTIAGYLLGRSDRPTSKEKADDQTEAGKEVSQ